MRVTARSDRGAVVVTVAIMITGLFAVSGLVVDLGNQWQSRRNLTEATDAAALAAAHYFADPTNPAWGPATDSPICHNQAGADGYLASNRSSAAPGACAVFGTTAAGYVVVEARDSVNFIFGRVVGLNSGTVRSTTTVKWGRPTVGNIRPVGICANEATVDAWIASSADESMLFDNGGDCGTPGNFGLLDLTGSNGVSTPTDSELVGWITNGYPGPTSFCAYSTWDPGPGTPTPACGEVEGTTGNKFSSSNIRGAFDALAASGEVFWMPIVGVPVGSGANADYPITGFLAASLELRTTAGGRTTLAINALLKWGFDTAEKGITCCPAIAIPGQPATYEICKVDAIDPSAPIDLSACS